MFFRIRRLVISGGEVPTPGMATKFPLLKPSDQVTSAVIVATLVVELTAERGSSIQQLQEQNSTKEKEYEVMEGTDQDSRAFQGKHDEH
jgi:hypothetical protein